MARILVIDDDELIHCFLRVILQSDGHEVHITNTGEAGLHCVCTADVDVIFCDLFMPGKSGLETIRELRRCSPGVPVIAMSAGGDDGQTYLLRVAHGLGAATVLTKPLHAAEVSSAVRALLGDASSLPAIEG
jgi:DNA-binding response OmpR family regulator